ncbi:hypothetical protein M3223_01720 [Paenibacillus pasadenensis]|uniref:hypothetical protein n=1 Tax=Paenibacillus pasadenensis TaxID=217090 RepID=UPI00203CBB47|nr:hypothetical protein [Paenibacillus pasadenensis]MCM3746066.1 hypothetical protein [Paenibacillus pasadenensis]
MKLGMILVLFILLVLIAQVFCSSATINDESLSIQDSVGFNVYNQTTNLRLETVKIAGDFESPAPPPHIIQPGGSYNYQVVKTWRATNEANLAYRVLSPSGLTVGNIFINMFVYTNFFNITEIYNNSTFQGPFTVKNGSTWVTIR